MADHEHREFSAGDSGASLSYPVQCSALRKGGFVCIKGRPCKIVEMSTSKTGKHGHAKVHIVGTDIFTSKKLEDVSPSTHNMDVPVVSRLDYQLLNIEGDYLSLMSSEGEIKEDVRVPTGDLGKTIKADFDQGKDLVVTVLKSMGEEQVVTHKDSPN